jgi:hypothetical protein
MNAGDTTRNRPYRTGTCAIAPHTGHGHPEGRPTGRADTRPDNHNPNTDRGPIDVNNSDPPNRRNRPNRASENDAKHTRPHALHRRNVANTGPTAASDFTSTFNNASGNSSNNASNRHTGSRPPTNAPPTTDHGNREITPRPSVVRSNAAS